jgi:hypothetical protein
LPLAIILSLLWTWGFLPGIPSPSWWAFKKDIGGAVWIWPTAGLLSLGAYVYWRIKYALKKGDGGEDHPQYQTSYVLVVIASATLAWWYLISLVLKR